MRIKGLGKAGAVMAAWLIVGATIGISIASAQSKSDGAETVGVMADGSPGFEIARALARAIDHVDHLRILPIAGKGPVQSLTDLIELRGVDAVIVPSDTALYTGRNGLADSAKLAYLAKIASLDVHVIAGPNITQISALAAKRVAVGTTAGYSFVSASLIFEALGIEIEALPLEAEEALRAVAAGTADAAIIVGMKPLLQAIRPDSGLHLLTVPFNEKLGKAYIPSILSDEAYPNLLAKGQIAETVATALVVAVINWPGKSARSEKIKRFTTALLDAFASDDGGEAGLNLAAEVPGWKRFGAAEDWLKGKQSAAPSKGTATVLKEE